MQYFREFERVFCKKSCRQKNERGYGTDGMTSFDETMIDREENDVECAEEAQMTEQEENDAECAEEARMTEQEENDAECAKEARMTEQEENDAECAEPDGTMEREEKSVESIEPNEMNQWEERGMELDGMTKWDETVKEDGTKESTETFVDKAESENGTEQGEMEPDEKTDTDPDSLASIEPILDKRIVRAVREMGFEKLTPIQVEAIPYLLDNEDIIGQAQTGTGKTAAFAIPALQKIDPELKNLQTVILCPTRELAIQAADEIRNIAKYMQGLKVLPVYGGQEIRKQINGLKGTQIIVGTPGRVMDHMRRHTIKLDHVNMVVLDEADEMLDMGFREDMELILGEIPNEHQTALFSATMPQPILEIANRFQKNARLVRVAARELTIPLVSQRYYKVKSQDKDAACIRLLEYYQPKLSLIFCNTKIKVDELAEMLKKAGFQAEGLHGDMSQHQRDVAMGHFRNGSTNILIATDVAARGIDVDNVEVVINYDIPQDNEYYVHRIGRTGRAGKSGRSFTFVSGREIFRVRQIEKFCRTTIEEKKLPGAAKVQKAKADKYLSRAWELREHEDIDLMKSYLQRKIDAEECDILELAAAMLKMQIGDQGPEIAVDDYESRGGKNERDRRGRRRRGRGEDRGEGENRESRRRRERGEDRGEGENRESRRRRERGEDRGEGENRESRRRRERGEDREEVENRESRRRRERGEEREGRRGEGESRRKHGREEGRGRRERERVESRDSRRKREREEKRAAKARDVRMDGSEKGIPFSFPKKKKKKQGW